MTPGVEGKTPGELALQKRALLAITEYSLIKSGAATLVSLGYADDEGRPIEYKLLEFTAIDALVQQAIKDKSDRGNH